MPFDLSWLAKFCDPKCHREKVKDLMRHPWTIDYEDALWTFATDGKIFLLVKGGVGRNPKAPMAIVEKAMHVVRPVSMPPLLGHTNVSVIGFWAGPPVWGEEIECPNCCESFVYPDDDRVGVLGDIPLNANMLAKALSFVHGPVTVYGALKMPLHFIGEGWQIIQMPIDPQSEECKEETEAAKATAFVFKETV